MTPEAPQTSPLHPERPADGFEIRVFDRRRRPSSWSDIIQPRQCAVFLRDTELGVGVDRCLRPLSQEDGICILFDSIDAAEEFCRGIVAAHPRISCEVLDHEGRLNPPLLTIAVTHQGGDDDMRGWIGRHRHWIACALIVCAIPLFWYDWIHQGTLVLTVLGINLIVAALRLLLWDIGARSNERKRLARLAEHRRREQQIGSETTASH